ncbi:unnamed protein product [Boreogadus saida]
MDWEHGAPHLYGPTATNCTSVDGERRRASPLSVKHARGAPGQRRRDGALIRGPPNQGPRDLVKDLPSLGPSAGPSSR